MTAPAGAATQKKAPQGMAQRSPSAQPPSAASALDTVVAVAPPPQGTAQSPRAAPLRLPVGAVPPAPAAPLAQRSPSASPPHGVASASDTVVAVAPHPQGMAQSPRPPLRLPVGACLVQRSPSASPPLGVASAQPLVQRSPSASPPLVQRSPSASPGCAPAQRATTPTSRRIVVGTYTPTGPVASPVFFATPRAGPVASPATPRTSPERSPCVTFAETGTPARAQPQPATVTVIAPGGGTGINGAVYAELGRDPRFNVNIVGQSRAPYDCYPEDWSHGTGPPNLRSFAHEVLAQGTIGRTDLLVVGSRGGQVVLPDFWASGAHVPPTVVINGGCTMNLPTPVKWPTDAITFILLGGDDNFRGHFSHKEYVADAKSRVPKDNSTTAILYVSEMQHMPQASLLSAILPHMLTALQKWEERGAAPLKEFRPILAALNRDGWSGRFLHTRAAGAWEDIAFSQCEVARLSRSPSQSPTCTDDSSESSEEEPIEFSRRDEFKALWKAAAATARPKCGAPAARDGALFTAVVQAATAQAAKQLDATGVPTPLRAAAMPRPPLLPVTVAGRGDAKALRGGYTPHRLNHADPTPISRALGLGRPSPWVSPKSSYSTAQYSFFTTSEVATGGA